MESIKQCKYCQERFENIKGRVFSNHMRWCYKNPDRNKSNENISKSVHIVVDRKYGKKTEYSVCCYKCKKDFLVIERSKKFPNKSKYFCSLSCANGRPQTKETKQKIRLSLKDRKYPSRKNTRNCIFCQVEYMSISSKGYKYCSDKCCKKAKEKRKQNTVFK